MSGYYNSLNKSKYIIYSVEDDVNISRIINLTMVKEGYSIHSFLNGQSFLDAFKETKPNLILMDLMLPDYTGEDLITKVRQSEGGDDVDIIIVSAKNMLADKIEGLDRGADDYIEKPFDILELIARINAHYRRTAKQSVLSYGELVLDVNQHRVTFNGSEVNLTASEFTILKTLMENIGDVISREQLISILWGDNKALETRTIDMHIKELRKKLNDSKGLLIQTVYGIGYKLGIIEDEN